MANRVHASAALLAAGLLQADFAAALGLGDITLRSFLNEPLVAEVALLDTRNLVADDLRIRLAEVEDFDRLGVERDYFLTSIEFTIDVDPATGSGVIRLSTDQPVVEPYLDFVIEARWPSGRLLREYTVLLDPPAFREAPLTVSASRRVAEVEGDDQGAGPAVDDASGGGAPAGADPGEPVAASGDRVRVLESDLGPGEMPARAFSAATSTEPEPGSRYMVRRDENLWQIAADARPEGVSVQQAMLDIQRLNPEAFIAGNINRIKAGYIIYLPSAADISSDDLAEALAEVSAQNRAWTSGRGPEPGVSAAASLRISADGEEPAAVSASDSAGQTAPPRDRESRDNEETAARADAGDTTTDAEVPAESGPATDSADSEGGAGDELAAQFAAMNERLDALEGMLAVKDAEIARLQAALREAEAADARDATASAGPASAATDPAEEAPSTSRPATSTPTPTPTPAPAPAPSPVQKPPAPVPDSSSGGLLPWLYGLGAAVLLALLAVVGLRRFSASRARRGQQVGGGARATAAADDPFSDVTLKGEPDASLEDAAAATPGAGPAPEPEDATAPPDMSERGYGERRYDDYSDDAEGNDALAEADIYIAYGRYLQAVELLSSAIRTEPENSAFRIKLLELYLDMGEEANAREQLDALRESGDAAAIERAERILGSGRAGSGQPAPAAEPQHEAAEESGQVGETGARELAPIEYDRPGGAGASAPAQAPDADARDEALSRPAPAPDTTSGEEEPGADQEELRADEEDPLALDAGLEELAIEEELPLAPGSLEDELDFGDIAGDRVPAAEAIDLGEPESAIPEPEVTETHAPWDAQDEHSDGSGDLVFAEDADRMATRLDLARAYLDMGDADGARTILEEVARAGDEEQQGEARKLLDNLA